jgi:predicted transglutaminase-like protease
MYFGLTVLSIGLFQMAFIDTDGLTSTTSNEIGSININPKKNLAKRIHFLQDQNIYPLFRVMFEFIELIIFNFLLLLLHIY